MVIWVKFTHSSPFYFADSLRMLTFTLAISCLNTSNLPWFMDLTFQVPMQYCSLQHQILLLSPVTSTAGYCFCFGSIPSLFLELFLHRSPVAYWAPTDLGSSSFSILSFCLFILFMGFSRHEQWSGLPFLSPVNHILSDLSIITSPFWISLQAWLGFSELDKAVVLVWFDWLGGAQSCPTLCGPMDCSPPGFSIHGISQQEYWNGLPFPTPGGHPNQGIEPTFLASPALKSEFLLLSYWGF